MSDIVQCIVCEMKQSPGPICRRCGRSLRTNPPQVRTVVETMEVIREVPVVIPCESCGHLAHALPTIDQMERVLIMAARKLFPNWNDVCRQLGIGRTTLYRKLREYGEIR